ncbi:MAG: methylated-DNA--[protein]-cysteine S-methyltransferase [bacterium]|nr:methylated-DNA--[protein]-cysteine S-methyltransferase [bacterium]
MKSLFFLKEISDFKKNDQNLIEKSYPKLEKDLKCYFKKKDINFKNYRLDLSETTYFQKKVLLATLNIPYGETKSYKWIANYIGNPNAYRAVGQALHRNPLPVIIPCHRIIKENGWMGGFSSGLLWKKRLLYLEQENAGINS